MPAPRAPRAVAVLLAGALLASACDGDGERPADRSTASAAPTPNPTSAPWASLTGALARCGPQPPGVAGHPFRAVTLRDPRVGRVPAVRLGRGRDVVVLLHQTDGNGYCGWLPFMPTAADAGFALLAIDLCEYGRSRCRAVADGSFSDADQPDPVAVAVDYARREMRARRVVVVGASMGGSVALMSGATLDGVDLVVDLSGPVDWRGIEVVREGRALEVPAFVATAATEGGEAVEGAATIVDHAPAGSTFVQPDSGHGYELLDDDEGNPLPLATELLRWIRAGLGG